MVEKDVQQLIEAFKNYRELLTPIQASLQDLADTYNSMEGDLKRLDQTFNGDAKQKLEQIYSTLSNQAKKSTDLSVSVDQFLRNSARYTSEISKMLSMFENIEKRLNIVNEIEDSANQQIQKLDALIEEKKKTYNVKELQKSLEIYNSNVQKISEFINKDVASSLSDSSKKIDSIKQESGDLLKRIESENENVEKLVDTYSTTNTLLSKIVEKEEVNEEYIFAILDKWANTRGVKIKK